MIARKIYFLACILTSNDTASAFHRCSPLYRYSATPSIHALLKLRGGNSGNALHIEQPEETLGDTILPVNEGNDSRDYSSEEVGTIHETASDQKIEDIVMDYDITESTIPNDVSYSKPGIIDNQKAESIAIERTTNAVTTDSDLSSKIDAIQETPPTSALAVIAGNVFVDVKNTVANFMIEYPVLKYILIIAAATVLVSTIKKIIEKDIEDEIQISSPSHTSNRDIAFNFNEFEASTNSQRTGNLRVVLSLLIGGLGVVAGSLSFIEEKSDGVVKPLIRYSSSPQSKRIENSSAASMQNPEEDDDNFDEEKPRNPGKIIQKIGTGAGVAWLGSGMIGRASVIKKVLGIMF